MKAKFLALLLVITGCSSVVYRLDTRATTQHVAPLAPVAAIAPVVPRTTASGPFIEIIATNMTLTNFFMTVEPLVPTGTYTNFGGTNMTINGTAKLLALIGPAVRLSWNDPRPLMIQRSTDLQNWETIYLLHIDASNWWTYPEGSNLFFRGLVQ